MAFIDGEKYFGSKSTVLYVNVHVQKEGRRIEVSPNSIDLFRIDATGPVFVKRLSGEQLAVRSRRRTQWASALANFGAGMARSTATVRTDEGDTATVTMPDYGAQQRAAEDTQNAMQAARQRANNIMDAELKQNTIFPGQQSGGHVFFEHQKPGTKLLAVVRTSEGDFSFPWGDIAPDSAPAAVTPTTNQSALDLLPPPGDGVLRWTPGGFRSFKDMTDGQESRIVRGKVVTVYVGVSNTDFGSHVDSTSVLVSVKEEQIGGPTVQVSPESVQLFKVKGNKLTPVNRMTAAEIAALIKRRVHTAAAEERAQGILGIELKAGAVGPKTSADGFVYFEQQKPPTMLLVRVSINEEVFEFPWEWGR
ncbi:MAG: hypothetical protein LAP21_26105 [Acidobacteriia bacterium]|nr:hypothetical protein [Terriglobia bacterium]